MLSGCSGVYNKSAVLDMSRCGEFVVDCCTANREIRVWSYSVMETRR